jgi:hypothetical protein
MEEGMAGNGIEPGQLRRWIPGMRKGSLSGTFIVICEVVNTFAGPGNSWNTVEILSTDDGGNTDVRHTHIFDIQRNSEVLDENESR